MLPFYDHAAGKKGTPALFVPSLVNRGWILDLKPGHGMLSWLAGHGVRAQHRRRTQSWDRQRGDEQVAPGQQAEGGHRERDHPAQAVGKAHRPRMP